MEGNQVPSKRENIKGVPFVEENYSSYGTIEGEEPSQRALIESEDDIGSSIESNLEGKNIENN